MNLNLKDKKVIVTGSSKGIGLEILKSFINEGALVVANSRNEGSLLKATEGLECKKFVADVSDPKQSLELIDRATDILGGIDILVCNVGSGKSVAPGNETKEEWDKVLNNNFFSTTNIVEASVSELKKSKGAIVCISSICGTNIIDGAPITYSVSKAALNHYIRGIAIPLAKDKIRINGIAAGNILFEGSNWDKKLQENKGEVMDMINKNVPLNTFGDTGDISNLALWLSSPISKFVTGSIYTIDGGQSCT